MAYVNFGSCLYKLTPDTEDISAVIGVHHLTEVKRSII